MANKKSNTKAKQGSAKTAAAASSKADSKKALSQKLAKSSKSSKAAKAAKDAKPGFFAGIKNLGSVRTELRRVTWPSKKELVNYSVAVCASLVVVGVIIAVLDMGISEGLALFAGLRG